MNEGEAKNASTYCKLIIHRLKIGSTTFSLDFSRLLEFENVRERRLKVPAVNAVQGRHMKQINNF